MLQCFLLRQNRPFQIDFCQALHCRHHCRGSLDQIVDEYGDLFIARHQLPGARAVGQRLRLLLQRRLYPR